MAIYNNYFGSGYNRQTNTQAGMAARQPQAPAQPMAARPPAAAPAPPAAQVAMPPAEAAPRPGVAPAPGQLPQAAYGPGPGEAPPIVRRTVQGGQTMIPPAPGVAPGRAAPSPWAAANAGATQGRAAPAPAAMTNAGAMQGRVAPAPAAMTNAGAMQGRAAPAPAAMANASAMQGRAAPAPAAMTNAGAAQNQAAPCPGAATLEEPPTIAPIPVAVPGVSSEIVPYTLTSTYYLAGKLKEFCGRLVKIEFVLGTTGTLIDRIGILKDIGAAYVTLEHPLSETEITLCDMYSIKFVTIYLESGPVMIRGITA